MDLTLELQAAGVDGAVAERLARYARLVLDVNQRFNVTGAKTPETFLPHVLDSLTVAPYVRERYVDIGSGAGLPAIPVAIVTGVHVTLVESNAKKAQFLKEALAVLGLDGDVIVERAEVAGHDPTLREQFACGTARAVSTAPTVAELLLPLIAPGGAALLQRGAVEQRERVALEDACLVLGATLEREIQLDGDRRILIARKTGTTQPRFPRRTGIPEKRPLCL